MNEAIRASLIIPQLVMIFQVHSAAQPSKMGDPLVGLNARIDWEAFQSDLNWVHAKG